MDMSADDLKRQEYEAREKAIRDHTYLMNYNLKKGVEEGKKTGREEVIKGFIKVCQEDSYSKEKTASRLIRMLDLSQKAAEEYVEKYWKVSKE